MNFRAHEPDDPVGGQPRHREPGPTPPLPEPVRRAIDRVAGWMQAELGLVMSGVRTMTRDVHALVTDVKQVFAALSIRLALIEQRLAATEEREAPEGPPPPSTRCRRRARPHPPGRGCRGRRLDH